MASASGRPKSELLLLSALLLCAGNWHQYDKLVCSDCHTMHNSAGGQPMRYDLQPDGTRKLLRAGSADELCLHCHGQAPRSGTPGVALRQGATQATDLAGGFFTYDGSGAPVAGYGHTIGVPPAASTSSSYLSSTPQTLGCLSCHDQHGTAAFRNLKDAPGAHGAASPLVSERVLAGMGDVAGSYGTAANRYRSGFSQWCMDCHDQASAHYSNHLDTLISSGAAPLTNWMATRYSSSGTALPRSRVQTPLVATVPDGSNQVFCLTCHKAHGTANASAVFLPDPTDANSLCAQCHVPPPTTP